MKHIPFCLFLIAGTFQFLYSILAQHIQNVHGVQFQLGRFSSYSYSRKHLKLLRATTKDMVLSKKITKLLLYESISILSLMATFVTAITIWQ